MNTDKEKFFDVPEWNIEKLRTKITLLQGKAVKLGCDIPVLFEHGEHFVFVDEDGVSHTKDDVSRQKIKVIKVSVRGKAPVLSGWKFVGKIEHTEFGNILKDAPECQIPFEYREVESKCDHCETRRVRKDTFIVQNVETKELKQVGRSCLADFLGHPNPETIVSFLTSFWSIIDDLSNEESDEESDFYGGAPLDYYSPIIDVLKITSATIKKYGWTSRSKAEQEFGLTPTSALVFGILYGKSEGDKALRKSIKVTDNDKEIAENAIEYFKHVEADSNYISNIQKLISTGHVSDRYLGYICSMIPTYERAFAKAAQDNKPNKNNYFGTIKERKEFKLTLVGLFGFPGKFGWQEIYKFIDDEGRVAVWKTGSAPLIIDAKDNEECSLQKGKTYYVLATIKEHQVYRDVEKQTVLTNCKVRINPIPVKKKKLSKKKKKKAA